MADIGALRSYVANLQSDIKKSVGDALSYGFKNIRVGLPGHQKPAENLSWVQLDGVTSTSANQEFSLAHGLGVAPRVAFPCIDLTSSGTQLVTLTVARAADTKRVYFRSGSTNAAFTVFVETRG